MLCLSGKRKYVYRESRSKEMAKRLKLEETKKLLQSNEGYMLNAASYILMMFINRDREKALATLKHLKKKKKKQKYDLFFCVELQRCPTAVLSCFMCCLYVL